MGLKELHFVSSCSGIILADASQNDLMTWRKSQNGDIPLHGIKYSPQIYGNWPGNS